MTKGPFPPFDGEAESMKDLKRVIWSAVGAGGVHRNEEQFGDLEEVLRQAKKYPNIVGAIMELCQDKRGTFKDMNYIEGGRVLLKNKERSDVINVAQNKLFREIARIMMGSMVGSCLDDSRTFNTTIAAGKGEWVATLVPRRKDMKQMFQRIILHFDPQQATVSRVELGEKNGDLTTIDLKNIRKNETIDSRTFAVE